MTGTQPIELPTVVAPVVASIALALLSLAGCGGGGSTSTTIAGGLSPTAIPTVLGGSNAPAGSPAKGSTSSTNTVALVGGVAVTKPVYNHWAAIERSHGAAGNAGQRALGFLITYEWVLGEAAARHITVSEADLKQRLAQLDKQSFPKPGSLQRFMASTGESEADLLAILRVGLLKNQIAQKITTGDAGPKAEATLANFEKAFQAHWKRYTTCSAGYVMEDCSRPGK